MTFWAYMLHCRGGTYYTGHTNDLGHRVAQHQIGVIPGFTADRLPVELVWSQEFPTRLEAQAAEQQIKGWSRAKKMALIRGDWDAVSMLAKGKNGPSTSSGRTGEGEPVIPRMVRPELVEGLPLICHPDTPSVGVDSICVTIARADSGGLQLTYDVQAPRGFYLPYRNILPADQPLARENYLWQTTCFELFARHADDNGYIEYNFSPKGSFAAYYFVDYRSEMRDWNLFKYFSIEQFVSDNEYQMLVGPLYIDWGRDVWHLALSAVIEEKDGTKSYWALRHPPGKPDFHHPDCFALTLEAPEAA